MKPNYAPSIYVLSDERLEALVSDWLARRTKQYAGHQRWSGPGDLGRDVVGYVTDKKHEGDWDNYQCKQLSAKLSETSAFVEMGKIFMHAANGEYRLPRAYYFVAPRGVVRNVKKLIAHPEGFRRAFLDRWDTDIAHKLIENDVVALSDEIRTAIKEFDFTKVDVFDATRLADDSDMQPVLVEWFGADPGPAPHGIAPDSVEPHEATYIGHLVEFYGERAGSPFPGPDDVLKHPEWGLDLRTQRTRYFEAAAFDRHYRDSTPPKFLADFKDDVYHGVIDVYGDDARDGLDRVKKVMSQAAQLSISGVLGKHARTAVKQGTCHHFANEGRMPWKK